MKSVGSLGFMVALVSLSGFWATGCAETDDGDAGGRVHPELMRTVRQQPLRPTDPEDARGYSGAEAESMVSPGGDFRVWWVGEGQHAVPATDADSSGVPDYVEMVARVADEVAQVLHQSDWKLAVPDNLAENQQPPGGDGRFDIYLVDFENGDGQYVPDGCAPNVAGVEQCAGHFRMENDFAGLNYPSAQYAARLVLSHEYFHAVQAAYTSELPAWWSEGSATWFEEYFDPTQDDFEHLTSIYFDDPARSLNDRTRGATDSHAYGGSIFVYFVAQQIGAEGVRKIFERLAQGDELIAAIDAELSAQWAPLVEAFDVFAVYNLFTGERAIGANGYVDAERFAGVAVESQRIDRPVDWNLDANPLGARYLKLSFEREISLQFVAFDGFDNPPQFVAVNQDEYEAAGSMHVISEAEKSYFDASMSPLYVVITNGHLDARRAATLKIRLSANSDSGDSGEQDAGDESVGEMDAGTDADGSNHPDNRGNSGCSTSGGTAPLSPVLFVAVCAVILRRLRAC